MLSAKEIKLVYDTLLSAPGMNDTVKVSMSIPRKTILQLGSIIELGLSIVDNEENHYPGLSESKEDISHVLTQLLNKAGLTETYQRINALTGTEKK